MNKLNIVGVASGVAALLLSAPIAFAEEDGAARVTSVRPVTISVATTTKNVRAETAREEAKARIEKAREEAKTRMEAKREDAKQKMETAREETKSRIEAKREEVKNKMEAQREKAKQRITDIRDKAKQEMAAKIAEQFEKLNEKWTDRFTEQLDRLGEILLKMQERADIAATNGKDVSATSAAIQSAKTAIATAQTAVAAQAAKAYVLNASAVKTAVATTTDAGQENLMKGLRTQFQSLHKTLFKDLFALRDGPMKDARGAVQNALQTLGKIPKVDDDSDSADDSSQ